MQDLIKVKKYIFSLGARYVSSWLRFICLLSRCRVVYECCFMSVNRQAVAQCEEALLFVPRGPLFYLLIF